MIKYFCDARDCNNELTEKEYSENRISVPVISTIYAENSQGVKLVAYRGVSVKERVLCERCMKIFAELFEEEKR